MIGEHRVTVVIGGHEIGGWERYAIETSIRRPADTFSLTRPFDLDAWNLCQTDQPIHVLIDGVHVITGYIDDREIPEDPDQLEIAGRDKVGRLVQESAPAIDFRGLSAEGLIEKLAAPWFDSVTLSNARNRKLLRGKGKAAPAATEPVQLGTKKGSTRIEPGQTRWAVIEEIMRQAGWIAWSSGDGRELVVGKPNYAQAIQWRFFRPRPLSTRSAEGNVLGLSVKDSTGDRYSKIIVVGAGKGTDVNYGRGVSSRHGESKNYAGTLDGEGADFFAPKRLILVEDVQSREEAQRFADHEMARRDVDRHVVRVKAALHGQLVAGRRLTLFANDTLAAVEDERREHRGVYLVTGCTFTSDRQGGETTALELVPTGTELAL